MRIEAFMPTPGSKLARCAWEMLALAVNEYRRVNEADMPRLTMGWEMMCAERPEASGQTVVHFRNRYGERHAFPMARDAQAIRVVVGDDGAMGLQIHTRAGWSTVPAITAGV